MSPWICGSRLQLAAPTGRSPFAALPFLSLSEGPPSRCFGPPFLFLHGGGLPRVLRGGGGKTACAASGVPCRVGGGRHQRCCGADNVVLMQGYGCSYELLLCIALLCSLVW